MTQQEKIKEILRQMFINTGLKLTEIGWETTEEEIQETASQIERLITEAKIEEASHYCDEGHYHENEPRDIAMLPSERVAELQASLKGKS